MSNLKKVVGNNRLFALGLLSLLCVIRTANADPMRVTEEEGRKAIVSKVAPAVPPLARQAHISGRVVVDMTVSEDGTVEKVDVVSGNPILSSSAVAASKRWTFQPFKSNGQASKAIVRATFDFGS